MKSGVASTTIVAALAGALHAGAWAAETRYDKKLEDAAKAKIAEKIGGIRVGFDVGQRVEFIHAEIVEKTPLSTGSVIAPVPPGEVSAGDDPEASRRAF